MIANLRCPLSDTFVGRQIDALLHGQPRVCYDFAGGEAATGISIARRWAYLPDFLRRLRVRAAFFADATRAAMGREAAARPPLRPPFFAVSLWVRFPRPDPPGLFPP